MVVSEMNRKPFCHLNLTFDLINFGSVSIMPSFRKTHEFKGDAGEVVGGRD